MGDIYVLDTSALLHEPGSIHLFPKGEIVIPIAVIEEIDGLKRREDEIGRNARLISRLLDDLRAEGSLARGVKLNNEGRLRVELNHQEAEGLPSFFDRGKSDNRILAVALSLKQERGASDGETYLVTMDTNLRVKADALGVKAEELPESRAQTTATYTGVAEIAVAPELIDRFFTDGELSLSDLSRGTPDTAGPLLYPNQFVQMNDAAGGSRSALARYNDSSATLTALRSLNLDLCGIKAKNREQRYAAELLLDDNIKLVTLIGRAGTGKTLLAVAAAMHKVLEERAYRRVVVSRPIFPLGNDLGYLPGEKEEKLHPWMQPIFDNLEYIFAGREKGGHGANIIQHLQDTGALELEALTYIRGRSLRDQFIVVDEAQNLSPHEILSVITRAGEGSKIVLTGDPDQIDHPYLDSVSNGLVHVVERFKNEPIAGHVTLLKGERSELATIAARIL